MRWITGCAVFFLVLAFSGLDASAASGLGGRCGGFAGFRCEPGLTCRITAPGADRLGTCVRAAGPAVAGEGGRCGGFAGLRCGAGLVCSGQGRGDQMGTCTRPGAGGFKVVGPGAACGGIAAVRCAPGLACRGVGPGDRLGVCSAAGGGGTVACPRIFRPVCGRDGRTYSNDCLLRNAGVPLLRPGRC